MQDPYVRKTAALCVAKLHDISPGIVRSQVAHAAVDYVFPILHRLNSTGIY
jgi:vesicle coat complex subunit